MIATRQVEKNPEAVLYYLYMMADGEISYSEEKIFDVLCKEMNVVEDDQKEILEECQRLAPEKSYVLYQLYESSLLKQLEDKRTLFWKLTKWEKREIIWNLINIGYADSEYSEDEKKIVDFLLQKWEISRTFYQELIDIADTMLSLSKEKEWVVANFNGHERDIKEKYLDEQIKKLFEDVQLTIEESNILEEE